MYSTTLHAYVHLLNLPPPSVSAPPLLPSDIVVTLHAEQRSRRIAAVVGILQCAVCRMGLDIIAI